MSITEIKKQELNAVRGYAARLQERIATATNPEHKEVMIDLFQTTKEIETEIEQFLASN